MSCHDIGTGILSIVMDRAILDRMVNDRESTYMRW